MKKRVLAVVLCLAMLIGYVPYFAFTAQASNSLNIYQDGVLATAASLPQNKYVNLEAFVTNGSQYQWQILIYGDNWVNITGGAGSTLKVTYAMIASLCNGGAATLRVKALSDGGEVTSGNFTVYVTDPVIEPSQENSEEEKYVVQDAPDAIIHDTPVSETTAPTQAPTETPTETPTEAPTQAPTESTAAADLAAAETACAEAAAAYDQAAAAYDLAAADLAAKQTAYEAAAAKRAEAEAAVQASAVVTTIPAEVTTNENGETVVLTPESTSVSYDEALVTAANAAAAEEAAALEARNAAQDALTQAEANKAAAEANKAAAEAALNAAKAAAAATATQPAATQPAETTPVTQPTETTPVTKAPSSNFTFRGSSNYALPNNAPSAQPEEEPTATTAPAAEVYNVVINYQFANGTPVALPYTAELKAGSGISITVNHPAVQGYLPYVGDSDETSTGIDLNITNIHENITYTVTYKPTNVKYTVIHHKQHVHDDNYDETLTETLQGLTESTVPDVDKEYPGFYALNYYHPEIAADGSTIVEIYYDRLYYLMNFSLDGGYDVEPIYARYETPIGDVGTPTKAGYSFVGWSLDGINVVDLPVKMPAANSTYRAIWKADDTAKVKVVFWGENADDEAYSYIKTAEVKVKPGTVFTYSEDGSVICGQESHSHNIDECYELTCTQEVHTHSEDCITCGQESHTHDTRCYAGVGSASSAGTGAPSNPSNGYVAREAWTWNGKVIYINGTWYEYTGSTNTDGIAPTICGKSEVTHNHTDACLGCGKTEHSHSVENGCYKLTCTKTPHSHNSECYMGGAGLDSNLWKFVKSDTVTVAADGSSVVNVYYDRTTFTIQFVRNGTAVKTIADTKWGADIHANFPIKDTNGSTIWWKVPSNCQSFVSGNQLASINTMPAENITFTYYKTEKGAVIYYYVETIDGAKGEATFPQNSSEAKQFDLYKTIYLTYSTTTNLTYTEEFHDIIGFKQWWSDPEFNKMEQGGKVRMNRTNYLCYARNSFAIEYYNPTDLLKTEARIPYEKPLSTYYWEPTANQAPAKYEPGSVMFDGWYLNPECTGVEFDFTTQTMPAGPNNVDGETALSLYAKWVPVTHTVEFYVDHAAYEAGTKLSTHPDITVPHGDFAREIPEPENGDYNFVGWFYMQDGVEKAYDFENMPVKKDLKVYGKWTSDVQKQYHIYYRIKDTDTDIAAPTSGYALAGTTKTFEAKAGSNLYVDYQEGYFPVTKSHSLTLNIEDDSQNTFVFEYVEATAVPYTVHYVTTNQNEAGSLTPIVIGDTTYYKVVDSKTVGENHKAVVTEKFATAPGYMPDAYQKRLVVSVKEDGSPDTEHNVIVFYYTVDTTHAYYNTTHYIENLETDSDGNRTWTVYASDDAQGDIGATYTAKELTIPGYTFDSKIPGTNVSGKLTENGLELKLYYTRNSYPYQVRYLKQGTGEELHSPKNGTAKYGQVVSESAITIENYTPVDPASQTLNIKIEESETPALNIITFYYTENEAEIKYWVVGPNGCGTVTPPSEKLKVLSAEKAQGSTATANTNYRFVGWYSDAACTDLLTTNSSYTPAKPTDGVWVDATYYAKFEYDLADLTITKSGADGNDEYQSFIFTVTGDANDPRTKDISLKVVITGNGRVTIKDLPIGKYYITEDGNWSWRYSAVTAEKTLKPVATLLEGESNTVNITNTRNERYWLSGDSVSENQFTPVEG